MNRKEIRRLARKWLDDNTSPGNLYSDDDLNRYINEGIRRAVVRGRLLVDSTTPTVTQIPVYAGTADYAYDKSIIVIRRAEFQATEADGRPYVLTRRSFDELDRRYPCWRDLKAQRPHITVQDMERRVLTLIGIPQLAGILRLTVWRYPFKSELLSLDTDEPCIVNEDLHERLAHWPCYRALGTIDAELRNPEEEAKHLSLFTETFGVEPSAQELRQLAVDREEENENYFF